MNIGELTEKARWARKRVLSMCLAGGAGHVAPSFSCTELVVSLYHGGALRFDPTDTLRPDRDRFILSKGQSANLLYAVLADLGVIPEEELATFTCRGSRLGGHAENDLPGVECFTGSLGHGLPIGAGIALAARMDGMDYLTYVLVGDGELQEGSNWEAAMFARTKKLSNLIVIVDRNGLGAVDRTENTAGLEPLDEKWRAFGWEVRTVDGHDFTSILPALTGLRERESDRPLVVIARTVKGKGVSFMEDSPIWHYRIPEGDEIERARKELGE